MHRTLLRTGLATFLIGLPMVLQSPAQARQDQEEQTLPSDWVNQIRWRSIGPANMSGRITDFAVYEADPNIWWAATASGGLLKTVNNGTTFEHQFDREATVSIGHVEVSQSDPDILWVGTGEDNPRNSVSWGNGVYKSTDGGESWQHMGLDGTFQTGGIEIHPTNPDIVYVGALGRLWGPNEERGLFKTTDGGDTWEKVLYVDDKTGVIDVDMHPTDPDTLIVATYERERDGFDGNDPGKKWGEGSGLWKTVDGGATWTKLQYGLSEVTMGRIGVDYSRSNPNNIFAVIETELIAQEPEDAAYVGVTGEDLEVGHRITEVVEEGPAAAAGLQPGDVVLAVDGSVVESGRDLARIIRRYAAGDTVEVEIARDGETSNVSIELANRPDPEEAGEGEGGRGGRGRGGRGGGGVNLSSGLGGQRENLQDQQGPRGYNHGGVYKSTDGGETWTRINSVNPRPMYYSKIRVDPSDENHIWVLGTSLYHSSDGGETFRSNAHRGENGATHVDHHAMWIDHNDGRHVILGNDGGVYVTYDRSGSWDHLNHVAIGQFYHVAVDNTPDYMVYGGLQDNGSWGGPSIVRNDSGPINTDWFRIGGGDGFIVQIDPEDPDQLYMESQNGSTSRMNMRTGERGSTRPGGGQRGRFRFNWKTPFILSHHNSKVYYSGGNHVFRSIYKGNNNEPISPDITNTDRGSGSALAESPLDYKVLYAGTTDGAVWGTRDFGETWYPIFSQPEGEAVAAARENSDQPASAEVDEEPANGSEPASTPGASSQDPQQQGGRRGQRGGRGGAQFVERLRGMDANENGKIERSEVPEQMGRFFDRFDANSDGVIDEEELTAAATAGPQGARGGRGGATGAAAGTESQSAPAANDAVSGAWSARVVTNQFESEFSFVLRLGDDNQVTGTIDTQLGSGDITNGRFNPENNRVTFVFETDEMTLEYTGTISDNRMEGDIAAAGAGMTFPFEATRNTPAVAEGGQEAAAAEEQAAEQPAGRRGRGRRQQDAPAGDPLGDLVPGPRWVSSIEASKHEASRVYLTLDGHRSNDDEPYVFASEDYGQTWRSIRGNLPTNAGSTRVVREDIANPNVLYLGCEFSCWVSVDRGESWTKLNSNLPTVSVHEIAQHPTSGEIIAGTHGRSIWIADITPIRQMSPSTIAAGVHLYEPNDVIRWRSQPRRGDSGLRQFVGRNPDENVEVYYSLASDTNGVELKVTDMEGNVIRTLEASGEAGFHRVVWDGRRDPQPGQGRGGRGGRGGGGVPEGEYKVVLTAGDTVLSETFSLLRDPATPADAVGTTEGLWEWVEAMGDDEEGEG